MKPGAEVESDHYCCLFDHRYAAQGLALIASLRRWGGDGPVWVLCLDSRAEILVRGFEQGDVRIVSLSRLEAHFPGLIDARADRTLLEYYYTLTPHLISYVFDQVPAAQRVAYIDGDMFFFGPVAEMWEASGSAPAVIVPHNFSRGAEHLAKYGTYNVGWVGFFRSPQGSACLDFWRDSCRRWCKSKLDQGRFADQGYLDRFVEFAPDLAIVRHKGCNVGPWNVGRYKVTLKDDAVYVDEDRLIFFHFSGFKRGLAGRWYSPHRFYRSRMTRTVRDHVYRPYLDALMAAKHRVLVRAERMEGSGTVSLQPYRGGGSTLKARLYMMVQGVFQGLDFIEGNALAEPPRASRVWPISRSDPP